MNKLKLLPVILCLVLALFGTNLSAKTPTTEGNGTPSINTEISVNSECTIPVPPTITANGPTTICAGGHVHLSTGNYSHYHWNTGANTQSINAFFTGTYHVTVTASNGCTGVASIHVTVHPRPHPVIHIGGPFNWCAGHMNLDAGAGYSSYMWSNGATTQTTSATNIGWYSCTVTNVWGCTGVAYRFIIVLPNPSVSISQTGNLNCGGGHATLTANGSWGVNAYSWSNSANTPSIDVTSAGTYCVTATSFWGCTAAACHDVTGGNNNISCSITASGNLSFCSGGNVTLDAGSWAAYTWSNGSHSQTLTAVTAGSYCCTVTDAGGCTCVGCIDVVVHDSPTPTLTYSSPPVFCNGGNVTLDAGTYASYSWSNGSSAEMITLDNGGTFCCTVTDDNGCTGVACQDVTVNPTPHPHITAGGNTTFCDGGSVVLDGGTWDNYSWNYNGGTDETVTATTSGTYCVVITDPNGCTGEDCMDVTVNTNPVPVITSNGPTTVCDGNTVTLDAGSWASYSWYNSITGYFSTDESYTFTSGAATEIVTVTDGNGCMGSASQFVSFNANPTPSISGNTSACAGSCVTLDAGSWDGYSWSNGDMTPTTSACSSDNYCVTVVDGNGCMGSACQWVTIYDNPTPSISGTTTACSGSCVTLDAGSWADYAWTTGDNSENTTVCSSGNYCVMVTDGNGCMGTACTDVTIYDNPTPSISGATSACAGSCVTLDAGSYAGYNWSNGGTNQSITACSTGQNCVTVTDGNGCSGSTCVDVTIYDNPTPSISGATTACAGSCVTLDAGSYAGYNWSNGGTNQTISACSTGQNCVTVTDGHGCSGSTCVGVTIYDNPQPSISGPTSSCSGSLTLSTGTAASYSWSNGGTNGSITVTSSGNYCVTVANIHGCTGVACQQVSVHSAPTPAVSGPSSSCGGSITLSTGTYASYSWSNGGTNASATVTTSGNYCVTVTDGNGCTGVACQSVAINSAPTPTISGPSQICAPGSGTLNAGTWASYTWSNGSHSSSITVTAAGTYCVTVTDGNGCTGTACKSVTVSQNPIPTISGAVYDCQGGSSILTTGVYAGYLWSTGATTQSITVTNTGNYIVTVSNAAGCTGTAHHSITVGVAPVPNITSNGPLTFCQGGSVNLNVIYNPHYTSYIWSNGSTVADYGTTITTSGTYCVTVSYSNGCTGTVCATVTVTDFVTPIITAGPVPAPCTASSMVLSANSGFATYLWSTGATTQNINITAAGTYTVSVTNANGCSGTASYTTTSFCPRPVVTMTASPSFANCGPVTINAGAGYAAYLWSNGATTQTTTIASGSAGYTVTVTNACGCTGTATHSVQVLTGVNTNITTTGLATYCANTGNVTLAAQAGYAYNWSTGATLASITITPGHPGLYCVTITSTNGCSGVACVNLSVDCVLPTNMATSSITTNSAYVSWNQPSCVSGYTIVRTDLNTLAVATFTFAPNSHYTFSGLTHGHNYSWTIQTNCSTTTNSGPSAPQLFTAARMADGDIETISAFNVYPNPATDHATVVFNSQTSDNYTLRLVDLTGRVIMSQVNASAIGDNQVELNTANIVKGVYFLSLETGGQTLQTKIMVQ